MTRSAGAPEALALALSPLLKPLRFLSRAGLAGVVSLRELEPLVRQVVEQARPYAGELSPRLDRLEESAREFDSASEEGRRAAIGALVRELSRLLEVPEDIAALAAPRQHGSRVLRWRRTGAAPSRPRIPQICFRAFAPPWLDHRTTEPPPPSHRPRCRSRRGIHRVFFWL